MPVSLTLLVIAGILIASGVYLFLERTLTRILIGFILAGNGVNLLFLVAAGEPGDAPFTGGGDTSGMTDPLPFALVLTAIVITMGVSAFVAALAHRAWQLFGHDEVRDDVEDKRVLRRSQRRARRQSDHVSAGQLDSDIASDEEVPMAETEAEDSDDDTGSDDSGADDAEAGGASTDDAGADATRADHTEAEPPPDDAPAPDAPPDPDPDSDAASGTTEDRP